MRYVVKKTNIFIRSLKTFEIKLTVEFKPNIFEKIFKFKRNKDVKLLGGLNKYVNDKENNIINNIVWYYYPEMVRYYPKNIDNDDLSILLNKEYNRILKEFETNIKNHYNKENEELNNNSEIVYNLDGILDQIKKNGMDSLTEKQKNVLLNYKK